MKIEFSPSALKEVFRPRLSAGKNRRESGEIAIHGVIEINGGSYPSANALKDFWRLNFYVEKFEREGEIGVDSFGNKLNPDYWHVYASARMTDLKHEEIVLASFPTERGAEKALRRLYDVSRGKNLPRGVRYGIYALIGYLVLTAFPLAGSGFKYMGMSPEAAAMKMMRDSARSRPDVPHNPYGLAREPAVERPDPGVIFGGQSFGGAPVEIPRAAPQAPEPAVRAPAAQTNPFFQD